MEDNPITRSRERANKTIGETIMMNLIINNIIIEISKDKIH